MFNCNFNQAGNILSYNMKIVKHMKHNNCERLKDYICTGYDLVDPKNFKEHPCFEYIKQAIDEVLKPNGWVVKVGTWKEEGKQIIVISPNGEYYHSKFDHNYNNDDVL